MSKFLKSFIIYPILGLKNDVPQNSELLFRVVADNAAYTHDTGGINTDYIKKRDTCSRSYGYTELSNNANSQATKCLGLFELEAGSNRDLMVFDNGKVFYFDSGYNLQIIEDGSSTTFANDNVDIYSIIQVGEYMVFSDRGEHTPYKWSNGDTALTKLIASGTEYKFRYIEAFQRRVIGVYSDQTNGDIEVRYSTDWPTTAITSLNFPATNQLYIPNDDSITGIKRMGRDRCFIYSQNSIHSIEYYPDYDTPFGLRNVVDGQGAHSNSSIVNLGDRHYFYNKNFGFCEFRGDEFPYGGIPISTDIDSDLKTIDPDAAETIVGTFVPMTREVVWAIPISAAGSPNYLYYYNIDTKQWRREDKAVKYIASWKTFLNYTWNDFITEIGGTGIWSDASGYTWTQFASLMERLVFANTNGYVYYNSGNNYNGAGLDGYRIEPILNFGSNEQYVLIEEIWFDIGYVGSHSINVYHRSGATVGEVIVASWTSIGSVSLDSPTDPVLRPGLNAKLHQFKWGTFGADKPHEVHKITFKYIPGAIN